ncbi:hypothetical protein ACFL2C_03750 [Patescibacteria group bacterium]
MSTELVLTIVGICAVVITASIVYVSYYLVQTLQKANATLDIIEETANDVNMVRRGVKATVLGAINRFIQSQGGDTDESK